MIAAGLIPRKRGVWIDCYNQSTNEDIAGTIIAGIQAKNHYFVTDMADMDNMDQQVLGWTRDEKGKVINRHPVEVANTVVADKGGNTQNFVVEPKVRIRKLTERECFRLMDVPEEYIDRIQAAGISRSQQAKMAGNSIVVSCMYHIFYKLFIDTKQTEPTLF